LLVEFHLDEFDELIPARHKFVSGFKRNGREACFQKITGCGQPGDRVGGTGPALCDGGGMNGEPDRVIKGEAGSEAANHEPEKGVVESYFSRKGEWVFLSSRLGDFEAEKFPGCVEWDAGLAVLDGTG
jgi:hypothetical protein